MIQDSPPVWQLSRHPARFLFSWPSTRLATCSQGSGGWGPWELRQVGRASPRTLICWGARFTLLGLDASPGAG